MVSLSQIISENIYLAILLKTAVILAVAYILHLIFKFHFSKILKKIEKSKSIEDKKVRKTRLELLRIIISNIIFILAGILILFLIPGFKAFSVSLLAGAGIAAIIIGFAAQKTIANIISGISIAIYAPFRIGDRIKTGEETGDVEDLTLRHTVIKTWDNRRVIIPNSVISEKEIVNYSIKEERLLWKINIGISYDSDIDKARKIMINEAKKHPDVFIPEIKNPDGEIEKQEPKVRVTECGDFAVNLRLSFWVEKPSKAWTTGFDLTESIKKQFDKKGIEIPFPYRTIVYKKDLDKKKKK
ncbi:MAG: mechanosensitive ion channel family protein [archaeon]